MEMVKKKTKKTAKKKSLNPADRRAAIAEGRYEREAEQRAESAMFERGLRGRF